MPYILTTEQKLKECCWMPDWALALPHFQLEALYKIIEDQPGNIIVDVGCFVGGFSKVMGQLAKERNGKVYSIDLFKGALEPVVNWGCHQSDDVKALFKRNMEERGLLDVFEVIEGDSVLASEKFEDNSVDVVFLDASHNYQSVKKDIEAWFPKIKSGGIICGHDYEYTTFNEEYVNEDGHGDRHHGVIKAVNEFFNNKDLQFNKGNYFTCIWSHKKI